jgi:hypothetical protein
MEIGQIHLGISIAKLRGLKDENIYVTTRTHSFQMIVQATKNIIDGGTQKVSTKQ